MTGSRVADGRRLADDAKRLLTGLAVAGFVAALLLARAAHPGHAAHTGSTPSTSATTTDDTSGYDFFGGSSSTISPGSGDPQVQSGVS